MDRLRIMIKTLAILIIEANQDCGYDLTMDYEEYRIKFIAKLDKSVKHHLFDCNDESWSFEDITNFLEATEYALYKRDTEEENWSKEKFLKIAYRYDKNGKFRFDYKSCPFSLLYKFFLDIVFENQNIVFYFRERIVDKELKDEMQSKVIA